MKIYYYYLLFRVYNYYASKKSERETVLFTTNLVSTLIIYTLLFTIYSWFNYIDYVNIFSNKYQVLIPMLLLGGVNYFLVVKNKKFLNQDFKIERKKDVIIVLFILLLISTFIKVANLNRAKIFKEQGMKPSTEKVQQKPSLEGRIRKWFK